MAFIAWTRGRPEDRAELAAVLAPLDGLVTITVVDDQHITINGTFTVEELRLLLTSVVVKIEELRARFDAAMPPGEAIA